MPKRITQNGSDKPKKPYADFPLFPHATKRWAKKIRGKLHYFGPWNDPDGALQKYLDQRDDLHAGRVPRATIGDGLQLRHLLNHYLTAKQRKVDAGELKRKTFGDYHACASGLADAFGPRRLVDDIQANDFGRLRADLAKIRGPIALGNEIQRVRSIFKYGNDAALIEKPVRYCPEFVKPSQKAMRQASRTTDKRSAERIAAKLEGDAALRREHVIDARAESIGNQAMRPTQDHLIEWRESLKAKGRSSKRIKLAYGRVLRMVTE